MEGIKLRALEPEDIDVLYSIENNKELWKYSNRNEPYSKYTLKKYIEIQNQEISESKQKRFVLSNNDKIVFGFIDFFTNSKASEFGIGLDRTPSKSI